MDYKKHYDMLIERALVRDLEGYAEKHHIIPRCMGGSDDIANIAKLTPEEHFLAHQLLVKIHPTNHKLILAVRWMTWGTDKVRRNNKMYGWIKRKIQSVGLTEEHKQKISEAVKGEKNHRYGKHNTDEHKQLVSEKLKGKSKPPRTSEHQLNIVRARQENGTYVAWNKGKSLSESHKQALRDAHIRRKLNKIKQD